ncbi:MAG: hypothetical protein ACRD2H_00535 [Terriglobales bacterium]
MSRNFSRQLGEAGRSALHLLAVAVLAAAAVRAQEAPPTPPPNPTQPSDCSRYQAEIDDFLARMSQAHQQCLDDHPGEDSHPQSILVCSVPACQALHDWVYSAKGNGLGQQVQSCQDRVAQYQQQQQWRQQQVDNQAQNIDQQGARQRQQAQARTASRVAGINVATDRIQSQTETIEAQDAARQNQIAADQQLSATYRQQADAVNTNPTASDSDLDSLESQTEALSARTGGSGPRDLRPLDEAGEEPDLSPQDEAGVQEFTDQGMSAAQPDDSPAPAGEPPPSDDAGETPSLEQFLNWKKDLDALKSMAGAAVSPTLPNQIQAAGDAVRLGISNPAADFIVGRNVEGIKNGASAALDLADQTMSAVASAVQGDPTNFDPGQQMTLVGRQYLSAFLPVVWQDRLQRWSQVVQSNYQRFRQFFGGESGAGH